MQMTDLGYGRGWLTHDAARSIFRIDRALGHALQITEAGRTYEQQQAHWDIYQRDGWPIALHPDTPSVHQQGEAIDSDEAGVHTAFMESNGWRRTVYRGGKLIEPWHWEYFINLDNRLNDPDPTRRSNTMLHAAYRTQDGSVIIQPTSEAKLRGVGGTEWHGILAANPGIYAAQISDKQRDELIEQYGISWP